MTGPNSKSLTISVRAVLFDMDGVLISSTEADARSWLRWAKLHGMEDTFSIHETHGRRTIDTIRALRPDLDQTTEIERMEDFDVEDTAGLTVYPGVRELLTALKPTQWSIVTSASDRVMRHRLGVLNLPVPPKVVTSESVNLGKPNPEPYQLGASQLGLQPVDCLVLEDSPSGIRAAKTAGCFVIAVASSHAPEELKEADWIVSSLEDLELYSADDSDRILCRCRS